MNDTQPKPATDWATETTEYCPISGEDDTQPKPTTSAADKAQKWTAQTVFDLLGSEYGPDGWQREKRVADAHNASITSERANTEAWNRSYHQIQSELAAERKVLEIANLELDQLRKQLAAEREEARAGGWLSQEALDEYAKVEEEHRQFERTLEAAYENHKADVARLNADYTRELNAKLAQINAQAQTIRELVVALKELRTWTDAHDHERVIIDDALAKVQSYPLPDGRTK